MSRTDRLACEWIALHYSGKIEGMSNPAFETWQHSARNAGAYLRAEAAWTLLDRLNALGGARTPTTKV